MLSKVPPKGANPAKYLARNRPSQVVVVVVVAVVVVVVLVVVVVVVVA